VCECNVGSPSAPPPAPRPQGSGLLLWDLRCAFGPPSAAPAAPSLASNMAAAQRARRRCVRIYRAAQAPPLAPWGCLAASTATPPPAPSSPPRSPPSTSPGPHPDPPPLRTPSPPRGPSPRRQVCPSCLHDGSLRRRSPTHRDALSPPPIGTGRRSCAVCGRAAPWCSAPRRTAPSPSATPPATPTPVRRPARPLRPTPGTCRPFRPRTPPIPLPSVCPPTSAVTQKTPAFVGDGDQLVACGSDDWGVYLWALEGAPAAAHRVQGSVPAPWPSAWRPAGRRGGGRVGGRNILGRAGSAILP